MAKYNITVNGKQRSVLSWDPQQPLLSVLRNQLELIDRPDLPPLGAGEAASTPVPAALANALFDALGVRLRQVPCSAARVREALAKRAP